MPDIHTSILAAVAAEVAAAAPAGWSTYQRKLPTDRDVNLPATLVCLGDSETFDVWGYPSDSETLYTGYPVILMHVKASNQALPIDDAELAWRRTLIATFRDKLLPAASTVFYCEVEPLSIVNVGLFQQTNLDVGGLMMRFWDAEART